MFYWHTIIALDTREGCPYLSGFTLSSLSIFHRTFLWRACSSCTLNRRSPCMRLPLQQIRMPFCEQSDSLCLCWCPKYRRSHLRRLRQTHSGELETTGHRRHIPGCSRKWKLEFSSLHFWRTTVWPSSPWRQTALVRTCPSSYSCSILYLPPLICQGAVQSWWLELNGPSKPASFVTP